MLRVGRRGLCRRRGEGAQAGGGGVQQEEEGGAAYGAGLRPRGERPYTTFRDAIVGNGSSFRNDPVLEKQYNNFRVAYWKWRAQQYLKGMQ